MNSEDKESVEAIMFFVTGLSVIVPPPGGRFQLSH